MKKKATPQPKKQDGNMVFHLIVIVLFSALIFLQLNPPNKVQNATIKTLGNLTPNATVEKSADTRKEKPTPANTPNTANTVEDADDAVEDLAGAITADPPTLLPNGELSEYPYEVVGKCPVVYYEYDKPLNSDELVKKGKPVILRNTTIMNWKALKLWREEYLKDKVEYYNCRRMTRAFVNYEEFHPLEEIYDKYSGVWPNAIESDALVNLTSAAFWPELKNRSDSTLVSAAFMVPIHLLDDVTPRGSMKMSDRDFVYFSFWIGEAGTTTSCHFDPDENFYMQIYGEKNFLLFPPEAHKQLHIFPKASPNHKQTQLWDLPNNAAFKRRADRPKPQGLDCTLRPGDLLYLPAYWFHHVTSLETPAERSDTGQPIPYSLSVNFWSVAYQDAMSLIQKPAPFDEGFPGNDRYIWNAFPLRFTEREVFRKTKTFMVLLVFMHYYGRDYHQNLMDLYNSRYYPIFGEPQLDPNNDVCGRKVTYEEFEVIKTNFGPYVQYCINALNTAPEGPVRELELWNWAELALAYPAENKNLPVYIRECMKFENIVDMSSQPSQKNVQRRVISSRTYVERDRDNYQEPQEEGEDGQYPEQDGEADIAQEQQGGAGAQEQQGGAGAQAQQGAAAGQAQSYSDLDEQQLNNLRRFYRANRRTIQPVDNQPGNAQRLANEKEL